MKKKQAGEQLDNLKTQLGNLNPDVPNIKLGIFISYIVTILFIFFRTSFHIISTLANAIDMIIAIIFFLILSVISLPFWPLTALAVGGPVFFGVLFLFFIAPVILQNSYINQKKSLLQNKISQVTANLEETNQRLKEIDINQQSRNIRQQAIQRHQDNINNLIDALSQLRQHNQKYLT